MLLPGIAVGCVANNSKLLLFIQILGVYVMKM